MQASPKLWRAPRLWPDGECFILGGGPSLGSIDINTLKERRVIAVNNAYRLAPWIDVMFFADYRWWFLHRDALLEFAGLKVTTCEKHLDKPGIKVIKRRNSPYGLSSDPGILTWNYSSGACAINLACHFGVRRMVLLGFDMKKIEGRCNWHEDHPPRATPGYDPYPRFLRPFPAMAADLKRRNIECLNATPGSALDVFQMVKPEDVL